VPVVDGVNTSTPSLHSYPSSPLASTTPVLVDPLNEDVPSSAATAAGTTAAVPPYSAASPSSGLVPAASAAPAAQTAASSGPASSRRPPSANAGSLPSAKAAPTPRAAPVSSASSIVVHASGAAAPSTDTAPGDVATMPMWPIRAGPLLPASPQLLAQGPRSLLHGAALLAACGVLGPLPAACPTPAGALDSTLAAPVPSPTTRAGTAAVAASDGDVQWVPLVPLAPGRALGAAAVAPPAANSAAAAPPGGKPPRSGLRREWTTECGCVAECRGSDNLDSTLLACIRSHRNVAFPAGAPSAQSATTTAAALPTASATAAAAPSGALVPVGALEWRLAVSTCEVLVWAGLGALLDYMDPREVLPLHGGCTVPGPCGRSVPLLSTRLSPTVPQLAAFAHLSLLTRPLARTLAVLRAPHRGPSASRGGCAGRRRDNGFVACAHQGRRGTDTVCRMRVRKGEDSAGGLHTRGLVGLMVCQRHQCHQLPRIEE